MTAKEKAQDLIKKFQSEKMIAYQPYSGANLDYSELNHDEAKKCALIAVEEIIDSYVVIPEMRRRAIEYWQEVKKELELL